MPWTFAHPAAVLPLRRLGLRRLPLLGLIMGSLAPDFGYYIGQLGWAAEAHTLRGLILICLPSAFVLVMLLCWSDRFWIAPLPEPHRTALERVQPPLLWPWPALLRMMVAIVLGALTHVVWDAFTHVHGAVVAAFPALREVLFVVAGHDFPAYNVMQHGSTLLGVSVLMVSYRRWLRRSRADWPATPPATWRRYLSLLLVVSVSVVWGVGVAAFTTATGLPFSVLVVRSVIHVTVILVVMYALLAWRATRRSRHQDLLPDHVKTSQSPWRWVVAKRKG